MNPIIITGLGLSCALLRSTAGPRSVIMPLKGDTIQKQLLINDIIRPFYHL